MPGKRNVDCRERLLDAADRLMWARGYEAVGVAELCAEAGAPRGSFYYWWPSKQALTLAMLDRAWDRSRRLLFARFEDLSTGFAGQLDAYCDALVANLQRARADCAGVNGCRFGNFAAELGARDPEIRAAVDGVFREMCAIVAGALRRAVDAGELAADLDADDSAEALCAHMEGLMILAKARNEPELVARLRVDGRRLVGLAPASPKIAKTDRRGVTP
jgi:TetR/AcrR family transcriptional repressor of nem operon